MLQIKLSLKKAPIIRDLVGLYYKTFYARYLNNDKKRVVVHNKFYLLPKIILYNTWTLQKYKVQSNKLYTKDN